MPTEYDITRAFKRIERELQASMIRNLKRHRAEEIEEGFDWEMWQHIQLKELERYRKANEDKFTEDFSEIDRKTEELFRKTAVGAQKKQTEYLEEKTGKSVEGAFFGVNDGKLNALITATKADFNKAEHAALRKANDDYRRVIFDAQVYASTGATYEQAVDMATKDFLRAGINSVVYKNGARHTVSNYAAMALRTGNKRAYLMGYGNANEKYGIHTVRVNKRQNACPLCVKWLGRVLVDDVYGGGTGAEASALNVPTLSQAMSQGFLHPNCKDIYSIYIEGVSQPADPWTKAEMEEIAESYNTETELRHAEDMEDTYRRMSELSLDPENQKIYGERAERWKSRVSRLKAEEYKKRKRPPAPDLIDDLDDVEDITETQATENIEDFTGAENPVEAEIVDQAGNTAQDVVEETVKEAAQAPEHEIVQGRDLLGTFKRRHDEFEFAINDAVNAQGFDGLPQVVPADKFDEAVKESNFVAQRTYSAPTAEQLEVYTDQLYNGDWYINCSTGGAQYGQGMYAAADYDGIITEGMRNEMDHYNSLYAAFNADGSKVTMFQLETDMQESLFMKRTGRKPQVGNRSDEKLFKEIRSEVRNYLVRYETTWESCIKDFDLPYLMGHHKIETLTLTPDARILTIPRGQEAYEYVVNKVVDEYVTDNLTSPEAKALWEEFTTLTDEIDNHRQFEGMQELLDKRDALWNQSPELWEEINKLRSEGYGLVEGIDDPGVLAALRGYDAINAVGHGESGSYTVILNRTKVIFKE